MVNFARVCVCYERERERELGIGVGFRKEQLLSFASIVQGHETGLLEDESKCTYVFASQLPSWFCTFKWIDRGIHFMSYNYKISLDMYQEIRGRITW